MRPSPSSTGSRRLLEWLMPRPWVVHGRSLFRLIQPGLDGMEPTDRGLDFCAPPNSLCELADYMATQLLSFSPRATMCGKGRSCRGLIQH